MKTSAIIIFCIGIIFIYFGVVGLIEAKKKKFGFCEYMRNEPNIPIRNSAPSQKLQVNGRDYFGTPPEQSRNFTDLIEVAKIGNYYHFDKEPNAYRPYKVTVKDEHCVVLTADNDSIVLYLENATSMEKEKIIYIFPAK